MRLPLLALGLTLATEVGAIPVRYHPLHTTLTEVKYDRSSRTVDVSIRGFADDLAAAVSRASRLDVKTDASTFDAALSRYLASTLVLTEGQGREVAFQPCGVRRAQDLVWVCLRARLTSRLSEARLLARMLFEVHPDQMNIVQLSDGARRQTLLFSKGDGLKPFRP